MVRIARAGGFPVLTIADYGRCRKAEQVRRQMLDNRQRLLGVAHCLLQPGTPSFLIYLESVFEWPP
jgi:hypothetical protein